MKRILYDVLKWHLLLHREARGLPSAAEGDCAELRIADEVFDRLYAGEGAAKLPEAERDASSAAVAQRFHEQAEAMPAWQRLATECEGDVLASAVAAQQIAETVNAQRRAEQDAKQGPGTPGNGPAKPGASALARLRQGKIDPADQMRRALASAVAKAEGKVDEAREAQEGLAGLGGWQPGKGPGAATSPLDAAGVARMVEMLRTNPRLRQIVALAGRLKRIAANKRRQKVNHGADEIADVEQGADLARTLPSELAKLTHPARRLAFLRDLGERRILQYRLTGKETVGRGPVVVLTDKSGSMNGDPDTWASALTLAVLAEAQRDGRTFALIPFESFPRPAIVVKPGEALPLEAILYGANGGTSIPAAMTAGLDVIEREGGLRKADLILITDGGSPAGPEVVARAKALNVNVIGLGIGVPKDALAPFCDEVHAIHRLDTLDDAAAESLFAGKEE